MFIFFFSSRRRHTRFDCDWSSDVCSSDLVVGSEPLARIRVKLKIAQVSEKVTVSGQSVVVAEENRSQARFDEHMVMNMPVRDADPLVVPSLFLNPAVVGSSGPTLIVDGVETSSLDLPTSSVKSVTVDQNPYSPEFGRPGKRSEERRVGKEC